MNRTKVKTFWPPKKRLLSPYKARLLTEWIYCLMGFPGVFGAYAGYLARSVVETCFIDTCVQNKTFEM